MIKIVFLMRRLPNVSFEEFSRHWLNDHIKLVKKHAVPLGIRRYVQSHVIAPELIAAFRSEWGDDPWDGMAEVWLDSLEVFKNSSGTPEMDAIQAELMADENTFVDHQRSTLFIRRARHHSMSQRVEGKVILVTGASGGIGQAIVARLSEEGASVIAADLASVPRDRFVQSAATHFVEMDVTDEAQWQSVLAQVENRYGRLDALVNNAGINRSKGREDPEGVEVGDLRRLFAVNFESMALGCKHAIPILARSGGGSIVNFSSIAALLPCDFIVGYGASKSAVQSLTSSVALHCARKGYNIRCNSVNPGSVLTPMMTELFERMAATNNITPEQAQEGLRKQIPMGAYQTPLDMANAVLFLVSDESRYVTGQPLVVDGGMMLAN